MDLTNNKNFFSYVGVKGEFGDVGPMGRQGLDGNKGMKKYNKIFPILSFEKIKLKFSAINKVNEETSNTVTLDFQANLDEMGHQHRMEKKVRSKLLL